jgi:4,5-DOPA dioxygenase extradiol
LNIFIDTLMLAAPGYTKNGGQVRSNKMDRTTPDRMPAIFFGHGSPMNALQDNRYTDAWRTLAAAMARPKAILAISAHWNTHGTAVTAMAAPQTIHDFGGFPKALFDLQYPAPGSPALAARVRELLAPTEVQMDHAWGLDHGTWSVLIKAFPQADIPVIQLSIDVSLSNAAHFELGRRLAALRDESILIIGTGDVVHNLALMRSNAAVYDWAVRFNDKVRDCLVRNDAEQLINYQQWGQDAALSVPTPEHFLPLLYVIGTRQDDDTTSIAVDGLEAGAISMLTAVVGARN